MVTRQEIVDEARTWIGTPFVHQQRVKGVGCDCAGITVKVGENCAAFGDIDIKDPAFEPFRAYSTFPDPPKMVAVLKMLMIKIRKDDAGAGDVIYRAYRSNPTHLAILTGPLRDPATTVIHAVRYPKPVVAETRISNLDWLENTVSAWRYRGVTD